MITVTEFPWPGENFVDKNGTTRGVQHVQMLPDKSFKVVYLKGEPEVYESRQVPQ